MTNSAHKLGKIRIYTGSRFASGTDVQWVDTVMGGTGGPNAIINGFKRKGRIQMSDRFSKYSISVSGAGSSDWKGAGYMLAHESGHYVYSLLDEYVGDSLAKSKTIYDPRVGDMAVEPSIMNDQWKAVTGTYRWLNFSTPDNIGDLSKTVQGRVHGADAWTVLARNASEDPHAFTNRYGKRTTYPILKLTKYIPTTPDWMQIDLSQPFSDPRTDLEIIWMSDTIAIDLVIDKSGSMSGSALSNIKNAANAFLDVVNAYRQTFNVVPSIGITVFGTTPSTVSSIIALDDNSIGQLKAAINAISAGGNTAMFDACLHSLGKLTSVSERSMRMCVLFTDGAENASRVTSVSAVVSQFRANSIPIYSFGYGSIGYHDNCKSLSWGTKGTFYPNLVGASKLNSLWTKIFAEAANLQDIKNVAFSSSAGLSFTVDPTVNTSALEARYTLQNANSYAAFTIVDNNGMQVASTTTTIPLGTSYPQEQIAIISIDSTAVAGASVGTWTCNVSSSGLVSTEIEGVVRMEGKSDGTYAAAIEDEEDGF